MNKKFLAVAVAGAFGIAPLAAFAQSSVTISGFFKGGFEGLSYGNYKGAGKHSQTGVVDDSSRIIFNVREDLGNGLSAIGQVDMRVGLDSGNLAGSGNNHVGLQSKQWGRIFVGRQDLHYFLRESNLSSRASLRADSISILAYAGNGKSAIANATRTPNVVHYTTPNWNGFSMVVAYSSSPLAATETDIGSTNRAGRAWNLAPYYAGKNFAIGYSYWSAKGDAVTTAASVANVGGVPTAVAASTAASDQRGDRLAGHYSWGGFTIGLAWDRSKITNAINGAKTSDRTAWSIPLEYGWGNHHVYAHFDRAKDDKGTGGGADTGASMFAIAYAYDLSKRTSAAITYARINNKANAAYNFFTDASLGIGNPAPANGEDPRLWAITLRHAF